jgi:hypothetical protein
MRQDKPPYGLYVGFTLEAGSIEVITHLAASVFNAMCGSSSW